MILSSCLIKESTAQAKLSLQDMDMSLEGTRYILNKSSNNYYFYTKKKTKILIINIFVFLFVVPVCI